MNILIYCGDGVSTKSFNQTTNFFQTYFSDFFDIKSIDANGLKLSPWESSCSCFVLPGGSDLFYVRDFTDHVLDRLRNWVSNGGIYIGICAGAYFASSSIEFEKNRQGYEICQQRNLGLIDVKAIGSITSDFDYGNDLCYEILKINAVKTGDHFYAYCCGGCYFSFSELVECQPKIVILGITEKNQPVIIQTEYGHGKIFLSGIHLEYDLSPYKSEYLVENLECARIFLKNLLHNLLGCKDENFEKTENSKVLYTTAPNLCVKLEQLETVFVDENNIEISSKKINFLKLLPSEFSSDVGKTIIYAEIVTSTQALLLNNRAFLLSLPSGTVFLTSHQTKGKGRGNNRWISSQGCVQFSIVLDLPLAFQDKIQLVQYITAISIVKAILKLIGDEFKRYIKIKWPNDIYCQSLKTGGILVNIEHGDNQVLKLIIGIGINLENVAGAGNLNEMLLSSGCKPICKEDLLISICNQLGKEMKLWKDSNSFQYETYYSFWMHDLDSQINVENYESPFILKGIDEFGNLVAVDQTKQKFVRLQSNGNSFDLTKNLICRKQ